jgi:hypothetical protein
MAQKVEILNLDINTSALISKMTETRGEIEKLKSAQKQLSNENKTNSESFTKNEVELKRLQSSYTTQKNVVSQLSSANATFANATEAITDAISKEITSITSVRSNNTQLLSLRNELNLATVEGQQALIKINTKLDENNTFIKENVSAYEQQKIAIGDYKNQIQEAFEGINLFNGGIGGFISRSQEAGGAGNLLTDSFKGMTAGIFGMIKASLAFLATPIGVALGALGLAVGLVVGAFKFMTASMNSTEAGSQKLASVTASISGIFQGLFKIVKPLGEYIGGVFIRSFETAAAIADKAMRVLSGGLKLLGFSNAAKGVDGFTNSIKQGSAAAVQLAAAQGKLDAAQRTAQKTQLDYQKVAEKLRQIRDDESLSIAQRTKANQQLGGVLKKQLGDELKIANQALLVANLRIKAEGKSKEALDGQAEALTGIADIQERLTGQESEQLANLNSLRKESADKAKEASDKAIAARQAQVDSMLQKSKEEIDLFVAQENTKKKSAEDTLIFEQNLLTKKLSLLKKEYDNKKISAAAYEAQSLTLKNEFAEKKIAAEQVELDRIKSFEDKKTALQNQLEIDRATSQAEKDTLKLTQDLEKHLLELEDIKYKETEKAELKKLLLEQYNNDVAVITDTAAATAAQKKADFDIKAIEYEKQKNDIQIGLAQQLGSTLLGLLGDSLGGQLAAIAFDAIIQIAKLKIATSAAQAINLANGTALSIPTAGASLIAAKATNIGLGISSKLQQASILGAAAISSGGAILKKVQKKADGGVIETLGSGVINNGANVIPLNNGDNTLAYVKQGEVILNQHQQALAGGSSFFKSLGVPGFNGGGVVGGNSNLGSLNGFKIDYDVLANKIAQANRMLPAPVVSVSDISYQQNRVAVIENMANL